MERRTFRAGEAIVVEGAETTDAYLLESGQVVVSRGDQRLRTLGPGEIFGEMALVDDKPRSATVTAVSEVVVGVIDRDEFEEMWRSDPEALIPVIRVLCDRVRALNALVDELAHQSPHSRDTVAAHQVTGCVAAPATTRVCLEGTTAEARATLGPHPRVIERFPFRIGRVTAPGDPLSANELSIEDKPPFHVSRNHCAITLVDARVFVIDRGSRLGTMVGTERVGNGTTQRAELRPGTTEIALGGPRSPFRYRISVTA
jgi:CRP/FNR family cyclic AMP-dependent transcriptional regulator